MSEFLPESEGTSSNEGLARSLHSLAPPSEFNAQPKQYFTLDVGKRLPKNAVTIQKKKSRVTFFVQKQDLISEASAVGITLQEVPLAGRAYNKDKYVTYDLELATVEDIDKRQVVSKLLIESIEIIEERQKRLSKGKRKNNG